MNPLFAVLELDPNLNAHWYLPPLIVAISLVYSATRYESWPLILQYAIRWSFYVLSFLGATYVILYLIWLDLRWYWYIPVALFVLYVAFGGPIWRHKPKDAT